MAESPERRVLKETITKLKAKNITSFNMFKARVKGLDETFATLFDSFKEQYSKLGQEDRKKADLLFILLGVIRNEVQKSTSDSIAVINDLLLYIEVLESYSVELDKTLSEIFEQAKKYAEEQTKQQQELMKKGETSYIK